MATALDSLPATMTESTLLDCRGIVKSFPGVQALRGVDFMVRAGQVHGLVGENGAGKSTLTKVLAGLYPPDAGTLALDGKPLSLRGTDEALAHGIVTVHQDINLIATQTVAENVFLANELTIGPLGVVRMGAMRAQAAELLARYGIAVSPDSKVEDLTNDQRKMVQIVKAISRRARVLLLDEPTSSLTENEVRLVLRLIRDLAAQGTGVVFISHYLSEVFEVCDQITVLRDGAVVLANATESTTLPDVVAAMIGRRLEAVSRSHTGNPVGRAAARGARAVRPPWPARCLVHPPQGRDPGHNRSDGLGADRIGQGHLRQSRHASRVRCRAARWARSAVARPERGPGGRHRAADQ